jgi:glycosyltransferase involved in cell wall biosynthesis
MKISIITITYNSEKTLAETIESVISQDYCDIEYIIVDGASKDGTLEVIDKYKEHINKVISEPDKGIGDAFNKGIAIATGDVIGIINSDDMLLPGALSKVAEVFDECTDVLFGNGYRLYKDGTKVIYKAKKLEKIKSEMAMVFPSTFVKKSAYRSYGVFDLGYKVSMDRELLLRMYSKGAKFKYVSVPLSIYRMGGVSDMTFNTAVKNEREKISLLYGERIWRVISFSLIVKIKMYIKRFIKTFMEIRK